MQPSQEGAGSDRLGSFGTRIEGEPKESPQGRGRGAGSSRDRPPEQDSERGREKEEEEITQPFEAKRQAPTDVPPSVRQQGLFKGELGECELECVLATATEKEGVEGPWVSVQAAGEPSRRAVGTRRPGARAERLRIPRGPKGKALQLLPAGFKAVAGSEVPGLQGDSPAGPSLRSASRWRIAAISRSLGSSPHSSRNCYKAGLANSQIPGDTISRRRRHCASPHTAGGDEALQASSEGGRPGFLESRTELAVGWRRDKRKGPRKRPKRQGQERKVKRKGPKRKLGVMGAEREGERRRKRCKDKHGVMADLAGGLPPCLVGRCEADETGAVGDPCLKDLTGAAQPVDGLCELGASSADSDLKGAVHATADDRPTFSMEFMLERLSTCSNLAECGAWLARGVRHGVFGLKRAAAGPQQAAGRRARPCGLFPLPVQLPDLSEIRSLDWADPRNCELAAECWLGVGSLAVNALYGCGQDGTSRKAGKVHAAAREVLKGRIMRFLEGESPVDFSFEKVVEELRERKVSYTGEEISQPFPLSAEQIEKGLPPEGHGGTVPVVDFLVGRTKFLILNPMECLLPENEWEVGSLQAKVHIKSGEELKLFELLRKRGIIRWVPESVALKTGRGPILNGLFGVVKPGRFTQNQLPVLRVIMNLVPANSILSVIKGDIAALPSASAWIPLVVSQGNEIFLSQGDMSCAFLLVCSTKRLGAFHVFQLFDFG